MIKFLDLKQINDRFNTEFITKFKEILESGWYILGKQCEKFENNFAKYCGVKHCIGVANGLDALRLIIKAYNFKENDEIIVPANTYIAS
ncbi:aminotransferase, partial [Campylobacter jejuni]